MKHLSIGCADDGALELAGARLDGHGIRISWKAIAGWSGALSTVGAAIFSGALWFNGVFADFRHVKEATHANTAAIARQTEEQRTGFARLAAELDALKTVILLDRGSTKHADAGVP